MHTTDIIMVIGLLSVFLIVVFGGFRTYKILEPETVTSEAQGCQQAFKTILVGIVLLGILGALASVLH